MVDTVGERECLDKGIEKSEAAPDTSLMSKELDGVHMKLKELYVPCRAGGIRLE